MAAPCCPWLTIFGEGGEATSIRSERAPQPHQSRNQHELGNQVRTSSSQPQRQPTYLERLRGEQPQIIDVAALPAPVMIGNVPTVTLKKSVVERGRKYCEFALIGRLDFKKVSLQRVNTIATQVWKPSGDWKVTPLGKGYFMLKLDSKDDFVRIWSQAWKVGDQVLYFSKWTPDFDIERQKSTNALVWIQFPKLGQQHWDYEALMTIAKGVGTPVGVDKKTIARELGFFANVLVDVDFSKPIPEYVNVREEDGEQFRQNVYIPKPPLFCSHCKSVGHGVYQCRRLQRVFLPGESNQRNGIINRQDNTNQRGQSAGKQRDETAPMRPLRPLQQQATEVSVPAVQTRLMDSLGGGGISTKVVNTENVQPPLGKQTEGGETDVETEGVELGQSTIVAQGEKDDLIGQGEEEFVQTNQIENIEEGDIGHQGELEVRDVVVSTITPMTTLPAGETTIQVTNGFRILGVNEEVPVSLRSVVDNAELLNTRINAFLDQNKGNNNQPISSSVDRGRQLRGRGRGRPRGSSSSRVNRDAVEASSLGLRRSQRDASSPVRLDFTKLTVLTGAGISTEAGIPDYRSPNGAYSTGFKPITHQEFVRHSRARRRYWARSYAGWRRFIAAQPGPGHTCLATLEKVGRIDFMITQNVDRLHHRAGSNPLELHGTVYTVVCLDCGSSLCRNDFQDQLKDLNPNWAAAIENMKIGATAPGVDKSFGMKQRPDGDVEIDEKFWEEDFHIPTCQKCDGVLKPDVVFFGDNVPKDRADQAMRAAKECDAFLVMGSSLMTMSAFRLVSAAHEAGAAVAIVNIGQTRADGIVPLKISARCGEILPRVLNVGSLTVPRMQ